MTTQEVYAELIAQTQQYLLREYVQTQWKLVESETYDFFKAYAEKHSPRPKQVKPPSPKPAPAPVARPQPKPKPRPAPQKEEPKPSKPQPKGFDLQNSAQSATVDFSGFSEIVGTTLPELNPLESPNKPKKTRAHFTSPPDTVLLTFNEPPQHQHFLSHVAKAIEICYGSAGMIPAASIEAENRWEEFLQASNLRLIIATDIGLQSTPGIQKHIKEGQAYIGNIPLLRLSDISSTIKDPTLKPPLWRAINQLIRR